MSPDAPPPQVTPIEARASPYTVPPQQCAIDMYTGTISCLNQQRAFLDGYSQFSENLLMQPQPSPLLQQVMPTRSLAQRESGQCIINNNTQTITCPLSMSGMLENGLSLINESSSRGPLISSAFMPIPINPNYVYGSQIVDERPDSPLNRVLTRGPTGPWNLVGYVTNDKPSDASSRDRTMMVYAQRVDAGRNRYNYRVTDNNGVPLDISDNVHWKMDGDVIHVPGQSHKFTLHLYNNYR
jgi:hypothetical protein